MQSRYGRRAQPRNTRPSLTLLACAIGTWWTAGLLLGEPDPLRDPSRAVEDFSVYEDLDVTLFASEPLIGSPTNLDIDARGRVWLCEVVNYHRNRGRRPEGDRILILEDLDGDGVADNVKVYYQGNDVDSAMGICVLGNRVIVTASPKVLVLTDTDGDDRADKKDVLFRQTGRPENDHSAHSFVFGPDGKLYWNFGNAGIAVHDASGAPVVDLLGNTVADSGKPYWGGMVFRCDLDGGNFEVLGHNFRNNYEVAVDSFGTLWQTDNDDDGNRGARLSYVMEYGNFGYRDERTGAAWWRERTGQHEDVGKRHFHQNDPGVVPNLIETGNGAPGGVTVYEGRLLPQPFWDQPLHTDTVTNVVHSGQITPDGAGYRGTTIDLLRSNKDRWFRPVDVCVAPDGSVFLSDWYDPGVGGHRQADTTRGRIYRIAPKKSRYATPAADVSTIDGAILALASPNQATRFLAWSALHAGGDQAEDALQGVFQSENPRQRARALWLLGKIAGRGEHYVGQAVADEDENIRIVGVRLARQLPEVDTVSVATRLVRDPSPAVRRECAIALRGNASRRASRVWATLATQQEGKDRWYLEALGIGADGHWDGRYQAWRDYFLRFDPPEVPDLSSPDVRDLIWRARTPRVLPVLTSLILAPGLDARERLRYFRAFDFHRGEAKNKFLLKLAEARHPESDTITVLAMKHYEGGGADASPRLRAAVDAAIASSRDTLDGVRIAGKFRAVAESLWIARFAAQHVDERDATEALEILQSWGALQELVELVDSEEPEPARAALRLLGRIRTQETADMLHAIALGSEHHRALRELAIKMHRRNPSAERALMKSLRDGQVPQELQLVSGLTLLDSRERGIAEEAAQHVTLPETADRRPLPNLAALREERGDVRRGGAVFQGKGKCSTCHVVEGKGKPVGPELTGIGDKLGRDALLESILFPSLAVSHGYEAYAAVTKAGEVIAGVLREESPTAITLVTSEATLRTLPREGVETLQKQAESLMPGDLYKSLAQQELVDLVEYLTTLGRDRKKVQN